MYNIPAITTSKFQIIFRLVIFSRFFRLIFIIFIIPSPGLVHTLRRRRRSTHHHHHRRRRRTHSHDAQPLARASIYVAPVNFVRMCRLTSAIIILISVVGTINQTFPPPTSPPTYIRPLRLNRSLYTHARVHLMLCIGTTMGVYITPDDL